MTQRQEIAILTAIVRVKNPQWKNAVAVQVAMSLSQSMSETELRDAVALIVRDGQHSSTDEVGCIAAELLVDVDQVLCARRGESLGRLKRGASA